MGQKTHPIGFRLGGVQPWRARWFAERGSGYAKLVAEDIVIREFVKKNYADGGISRVEIERDSKEITVSITTSRPGIVIGRNGKRIDGLRNDLKEMLGKAVRINIFDQRMADLDAVQVAQSIAYQLEGRVAFRRALRNAIQRTMNANAKGIKIQLSGRLGGAEIARSEVQKQGAVPLHTISAWIDYAIVEAHTTYGTIGVKVWIYRGLLNLKSDDLDIQTTEGVYPVSGSRKKSDGATEEN